MRKNILLMCMAIVLMMVMPVKVNAQEDLSQYMSKLKAGDVAPEFVAKDTLGVEHRLSDLKGKLVVVDFWASWCGDCRREIPEVKALYADYHDKGYEFVSVSFDHDAGAWRHCIGKEAFPWLQVSNLVAWKQNPISIAYDIHWVPTLFLVDEEGKVVGSALSAKDFRKMLEERSK